MFNFHNVHILFFSEWLSYVNVYCDQRAEKFWTCWQTVWLACDTDPKHKFTVHMQDGQMDKGVIML